jgi:hypothetical protein
MNAAGDFACGLFVDWIVLLVEQENLARIVSVTFKIDHCPIEIRPLPLVVWMCSVKTLVAGALQLIFRFAAEGVSVTGRNYVRPVTRHPHRMLG